MERAELKNTAKKLMKNRVFTLFAILLLMSFATSILQAVPMIGAIILFVVAGAINLSSSYIFFRLADKNKDPVIEDVVYGFRDDNFIRSLVANIRVTLFTFLWTLLFIIPGIIKGIAYSQIYYIMADHPKMDAGEAQNRSIEMMKGHKWEYFLLQLSFIPWHIAAIFTFGLLYIYVMPYIETTNAVYYKRLSVEYTKKQVSEKVEAVKEAVTEAVEKVTAKVKKTEK